MQSGVTIRVSDNQGGTTTTSFDWTIINPAPTATNPGNQANTEGETVSLQIQATDDDMVTYTATGLPPGLAIDTNTGEISGAVATGASSGSPYPVAITVTDGQAGTTVVSFDWSIAPLPPTLGSVSPSSAAQGATLDVTLTGSNFIDGISSVAFSGTGITLNTTTAGSDTEIVVNITLDADAPTGERAVTVTNPGGGTSAAQPFIVTL
jgi:hypothetical protein